MVRPITLLVSLTLAAGGTHAQTSTQSTPASATGARAGIGTCSPGTASADLDIGGARARLYNTGGLFWGSGDPVYEVPRDSDAQAVSSASIWVGGTVNGELRFAGADYADWEWWPGPLNANGGAPSDCTPFDRIWVVTSERDGTITGDVADWPASLGAPFNDLDGDGTYEPGDGETPLVYGHQTAFWVMNDRGNVHAWSGAEPLGLTVRVTAHTFAVSRPAVGFATFYRYTFENPNAYAVENGRFGLFTDAAIGSATDDYMGSDPARGMAFVYNGDLVDEAAFGYQPPALGVDILSGASGAFHYESDASERGVPTSAEHAYAYLNFRFPDGTPLSVGGLGYNPDDPTAAPTTWQWPGAPEAFASWSEFDLDGAGTSNAASDRRFLAVAEPFELEPGGRHTVDIAILWGRGVSFLDSVTRLRSYSDQVQALYDEGEIFALGGARTGAPLDVPSSPLVELDTPVTTFPADGTNLADVSLPRTDPECGPDDRDRNCTEVELAWSAVDGALFYEVQVGSTPNLSVESTAVLIAREPALLQVAYSDDGPQDIYWRVRARTTTAISRFSDTQRYTTRHFVPTIQEGGIVETTYAATQTCEATPSALGCENYGGATVWQTPNPNADYYVTARAGTLDGLQAYADVAAPYDYELRFTEACAGVDCYGIDYRPDGTGIVVAVPFELWQIGIGTPGDPSDDVRLIPFLRETQNDTPERWRYAAAPNPGNGDDLDSDADFAALVSDAIYWMYPDRPDGYARFADAVAETGIGAPLAEADAQVDPDPTTGVPCERQGFFVDFCHQNDLLPDGTPGSDFVSLLSGLVLADQAGDQAPPPVGTVIRILTAKSSPPPPSLPPPTGETPGEAPLPDPSPSTPETITLEVFPNPVSDIATIRYRQIGRSGATLKVYDSVGRLVASLDEGVLAPGLYERTLDAGSLTSGIYWVVFRSVNARVVRPVSVVR